MGLNIFEISFPIRKKLINKQNLFIQNIKENYIIYKNYPYSQFTI
jgi:hypothetical protein